MIGLENGIHEFGRPTLLVESEKLRELIASRGLSQAELARLSGVSRATINKLLGRSAGPVRQGTIERIAPVLGVSTTSLDRDGIESSYLEAVAKKNRYLCFTGLGIVRTRTPIPLEQGFAAPSLRPWREERDCRQPMPGGERPNAAAKVTVRGTHIQQSISVGSILRHSRRQILLGEPGGGKTTVVREIARCYAQRRAKDRDYPTENLVPVLVRLAAWAAQIQNDSATDVFDATLAELDIQEPSETSEWLRRQSKQGRVIFLLDGLDEVPDPNDRGALIEKVRNLIRAYPESRWLVTSRTVGFDDPNLGERFDVFEIRNLPESAIRDFAAQWCAHRHGHPLREGCDECARRLEQLRHAIIDHPRIRALAGNPMMLTILCLLHDAGAALPQRRWQLFDKICEAFLFSWQENKRPFGGGTSDTQPTLDDREVLWLMESIALEMQRSDMTLVPRWWLSRHVTAFLRDDLKLSADIARAQADSVIWSLEHRSGLLRERGPERFGFWHLTFQEHFAARAVLEEQNAIEAIRPYFYHPRWREVVRMVGARLDRKRAPRLLSMVLDDPDPTGRALGRGVLLALGCLTDGAPVHEPRLLDQIAAQVEQLGASKWIGIAFEAIDLLADLKSTRIEQFARRRTERMIANARASLDGAGPFYLRLRAAFCGLIDGPELGALDAADDDTPPAPIIEIPFEDSAVRASMLIIVQNDDDQEKAASRVIELLNTSDSVPVRVVAAGELTRFARDDRKTRNALLQTLATEREERVRRAIIESLEPALSVLQVKRVVTDLLDNDASASVRGACAAALGSVAQSDSGTLERLLGILRSSEHHDLREGAAQGLTGMVERPEIRALLYERMADGSEDDGVRVACLRAIENELPTDPEALRTVSEFLMESSSARLPQVAADILAGCASSQSVPWSDLPIEKIEQVLVSADRPCQHLLDALRGLMDARELRRLGIPHEKRIANALASVRDRVARAFIFGSAARGEQGAESDIDLMVIGDVSLRELTPGLRQAESELGRQINAVVYSQEEWEDRIRQKNPFVTEVASGKTIPIFGAQDESTAMA